MTKQRKSSKRLTKGKVDKPHSRKVILPDDSDSDDSNCDTNIKNLEVHCLPSCKHNRAPGPEILIKCSQCMLLFHPSCCGDPVDDPHNSGFYSCLNCRQIYKRLMQIEQKLENVTSLNRELITMLEKSQQECSSLREVLKSVVAEKTTSAVTTCSTQTSNLTNNLHHLDEQENNTQIPNKPIPKPRTRIKTKLNKSDHPNVTVIGDSIVRDSGKIISDRLHSSYHTCVLSTSGLDINTAKKSIPAVLQDRKNNHDLVVLHVGTNDVAQLSLNEMVNRFEKLINTTKNFAPNHKIILNAVAKRLTPGSESINHKIDNFNKRISEMFEHDPNCFYVNCNPEQVGTGGY